MVLYYLCVIMYQKTKYPSQTVILSIRAGLIDSIFLNLSFNNFFSFHRVWFLLNEIKKRTY